MLGVGQSGDGESTDIAPSPRNPGGQVVQFSLFDISDTASPRRIDTQTYGGGSAAAEFDPQAFLHWQPRDLITAPMNLHGDRRRRRAFSGLVLLRIMRMDSPNSAASGGPPAYVSVNRSLVTGDTVYMPSDQALQAHILETHREVDELLL